MNKYHLNFLRWITRGEIPDVALKTAHSFGYKKSRFYFKCKFPSGAEGTHNWRFGYGSSNGKEE